MNNYIVNPYLGPHDIFAKHSDFIFTTSKEPMSGETIRSVRKEINNTLGIKIPYESPLFQMLKRGIGVYLESMPDEYNWQLQKLLSKKEIGIVISDNWADQKTTFKTKSHIQPENLSLYKNCVLMRDRIWAPEGLKRNFYNNLHLGLRGMDIMMRLALRSVFWKQIKEELKEFYN